MTLKQLRDFSDSGPQLCAFQSNQNGFQEWQPIWNVDIETVSYIKSHNTTPERIYVMHFEVYWPNIPKGKGKCYCSPGTTPELWGLVFIQLFWIKRIITLQHCKIRTPDAPYTLPKYTSVNSNMLKIKSRCNDTGQFSLLKCAPTKCFRIPEHNIVSILGFMFVTLKV